MSDISPASEARPISVVTLRTMTDDDLAALRRAVAVLERPSIATRLSAAAGAPLDMIGRALPAPVTDVVARSAEGAMRAALRVALATLQDKAVTSTGTAIDTATVETGNRLGRLFQSSDSKHKAMAALSGAVGGAFGLATLAVELPVSTTLMLRSIAEIAREEGEDLGDPESALACIQVFALGGRNGADTALSESGYFAVRAALTKTMAEAAKYAANRSVLDSSAPALIRFASQIASRFGIVVSQKVAAQAVPVIGAVGGAAINTAFMNHFQAMARAHFTVRRLERRYGADTVRDAYASEKDALGLS